MTSRDRCWQNGRLCLNLRALTKKRLSLKDIMAVLEKHPKHETLVGDIIVFCFFQDTSAVSSPQEIVLLQEFRGRLISNLEPSSSSAEES